MEALDPWRLAKLYGIEATPRSTLAVDSVIREHLTVSRPEVFSGALVPYRNGAVIVETDAHPSARRRSTMGDGLAHVFGEHKFGASLVTNAAADSPTKLKRTKPPRSPVNASSHSRQPRS